VTFRDGTTMDAAAVIWASGYRLDHSWIDLPVTGADGKLRHRRGVTDVPGLYFLGLPWQYTRGSALIGFVKDDAEHIAEHIAERATTGETTPLEGAALDGR
jgi:putative flavoprotein involved in K+ transport